MKKILVIKLGAFGDFIQSLAPARVVRSFHEKDQISLLTTPGLAPFARTTPYFDDVGTWRRDLSVTNNIRVWRWIRKMKFDRVYDLQNNARTRWLFKSLIGARSGWSGAVAGSQYHQPADRRQAIHSLDRLADQLQIAGVFDENSPHYDDFFPKFDWDLDDTTNALINNLNLKSAYVVIVPGTSKHRPEKKWPIHNYAILAQRLVEKQICPVIVGDIGETALAENILEICPQAISLVGQTKVADLIILGKNAMGCVSNDTGPAHIFAACVCPTLVLFSQASDPRFCSPRGPRVDWMRSGNLSDISVESAFRRLMHLAQMEDASS